jgi:hypothetical protein
MNKNDEIGLIGWGLKLGQQVFFHSSNIDIDDPVVQITLEDIRGIINFSQPNLKFFSLEFNNAYKIYTIYRSIFDWVNRDGAYYAMSIFVPHKLDTPPKEVIRLLNELLDRYHNNYIDILSNQIKRIKEDPTLFFNIIKTFNFFDRQGMDTPIVSDVQNMRYAYISYSSEDELSSFFDEPYREEYSQFKEVYFIDSKLEQENRLRVSSQLVKLSIPSILPRYTVQFFIYENVNGERKEIQNAVINVGVNGLPQFSSLKLNRLKENDSIQITISKDGYDEINLNLLVSRLFMNSSSRETDYDIELKKKKIEAKLIVQDKEINPIAGVELDIWINEDNKKKAWTDQNGQFTLTIDVEDIIVLDLNKDGYLQRKDIRWYNTPPKFSFVVTLEKEKINLDKEVSKIESKNKLKSPDNRTKNAEHENDKPESKAYFNDKLFSFLRELNNRNLIPLIAFLLVLVFIIVILNTENDNSLHKVGLKKENENTIDSIPMKRQIEIKAIFFLLKNDSFLLLNSPPNDVFLEKLQERYSNSLLDSINRLRDITLYDLYEKNKNTLEKLIVLKNAEEQKLKQWVNSVIQNAKYFANSTTFQRVEEAKNALFFYRRDIRREEQDQELINRLNLLIDLSRLMYNYRNASKTNILNEYKRTYGYDMVATEVENQVCADISKKVREKGFILTADQLRAVKTWQSRCTE